MDIDLIIADKGGDHLEHLPNELITSLYQEMSTTKEIVVEKGSANLEYQGTPIIGTGELIVKVLPKPRLYFRTKHYMQQKSGNVVQMIWKRSTLKKIIFNGSEYEVEPHDLLYQSLDQSLSAEFSCLTNEIEYDSSQLSEVTFHIFNLPLIGGGTNYWCISNGNQRLVHQFEFKYMKWVIILQAVENYTKVVDALKKDSGYQITYLGRIKRADGEKFTSIQALEMIEKFGLYLTFMLGIDCMPSYLVGTSESRVCWKLVNATGELYTESRSVTDHINCEIIDKAYEQFMKGIENRDIYNSILNIIEAYTAANRMYDDLPFGIIIAQSALEHMAKAYLKYILRYSEKTLKDYSSSKIIKELIDTLKINDTVDYYPQTELIKFKKTYGTTGMIDTLIRIRNIVAHPQKRYTNASEERLYYQAVTQYLWLIEIAMLSFIKYRGKYSCRLDYPYCPGKLTEIEKYFEQ